MKKVILILFVLLCGITAVSAQTAQRTAKKATFFMPENALKSQPEKLPPVRVRQPTSQNKKTTKQPIITHSVTTKQTVKNQTPQPKLSTPKSTTKVQPDIANARLKVQPAVNTAKQSLSKEEKNTDTDAKQTTSVSAQNEPAKDTETKVTTTSSTTQIEASEQPKIQAESIQQNTKTNEADPFAFVLKSYYEDTALIGQNKPYNNPRLKMMLEEFRDEDHILN